MERNWVTLWRHKTPKPQSLDITEVYFSLTSDFVDREPCSSHSLREESGWRLPLDIGEGSVWQIGLCFLKGSTWKWHITSTQTPLAEVTSMVVANLGMVGTQKGRGMWSYCRTFTTSNKGRHPSFMSLCFVCLWFSPPCSQPVLTCRFRFRWEGFIWQGIYKALNKWGNQAKKKKEVQNLLENMLVIATLHLYRIRYVCSL